MSLVSKIFSDLKQGLCQLKRNLMDHEQIEEQGKESISEPITQVSKKQKIFEDPFLEEEPRSNYFEFADEEVPNLPKEDKQLEFISPQALLIPDPPKLTSLKNIDLSPWGWDIDTEEIQFGLTVKEFINLYGNKYSHMVYRLDYSYLNDSGKPVEQYYIGKKSIKKKIKGKLITNYSNIEDYYSSSQIIGTLIRDGAIQKSSIKRTVLKLCVTSKYATLLEAQLLFKSSFLEPSSRLKDIDKKCSNSNILGNFFRNDILKEEEKHTNTIKAINKSLYNALNK